MKKFISILLSAVLLSMYFTVFSVPVMASEWLTSSSGIVCCSIRDAKPGDTINIFADTTYDRYMWMFVDQTIVIDKPCTINFQDYHFLESGCRDNLIYVNADNVTLNFKNCTFDTRTASKKISPIYVTGKNCVINGNGTTIFDRCDVGANYGGAIYTKGENTTIENCTFNNCTARYYGGAIYANHYRCKIISCNFTNCKANGGWAGAVYLNYGGKDKDNPSLIENCNFDNCSSNGGYAEALFVGGVYTTVKDCEFHDMTVSSDICYIGYSANEEVRFEKCKFYNNKPADGHDSFMDIWGTHSVLKDTYTYVEQCSSNNPNKESRYYHCTPAFCSEWYGSTISEGNTWIIAGIAVVAIVAIAVIVAKKKKKVTE